MTDRININDMAALLDLSPRAFRQQMWQSKFRELGETVRHNRLLTLDEFAHIRLCLEFQAGPRSINDVYFMAGGLLTELQKHLSGEAAGDTFAVLFEGHGLQPKRTHVLCDSLEEAAGKVGEGLARGWPRVQVANLREIAEELLVAFCFATGREQELAVKYRQRLPEMSPEEIARAEHLLALFHKRMSHRPDPPEAVSLMPPGALNDLATARAAGNG